MKNWLITYNAFLCAGWLVFTLAAAANGFNLNGWQLWLLNIVQFAALLEILHAAMGWVRSPVFTTAIQVLSRVFVLVIINLLPKGELLHLGSVDGVQLCALAWGVTEIVRYGYYTAGLTGKSMRALTTMRYSFFIVLYPLGVTGEVLVLLSWVSLFRAGFTPMNIAVGIVLLLYLIFFPQLYGYMWKQRRKKL